MVVRSLLSAESTTVLVNRLNRISLHVNRRAVIYLALFSVGYFALAGRQALIRPLWHDELYTRYLLHAPTARDLWAALANGVDLMPPLYHLIVRVLTSVLGDGPLVLRLPSMVGFWVMCLCLYRYVSLRLPAEFGFAAMLIPFCTSASTFMAEARPYGLVLGLGGVALVSWQALDGRTRIRAFWLACLAFALTAAISAHYYAVFLILPLAAGEIVRSATHRAVRWIVWACLLAPLTVLLALWPLIHNAREFAPTFWAQAKLGKLFSVYNAWLGHSDWVFFGLLAATALVFWLKGPAEPADALTPPAIDVVPPVVLLAVPAVGAIVAVVTGSGFAPRYVLPAVMGFAILASYVLARLFGPSPALRLLVVGALLLNAETLFRSRGVMMAGPGLLSSEIQNTLLRLEDQTAPVLIASPNRFLEVAYYAPSDLARRIRYLANRERAIHYTGTDTPDRSLTLLAQVAPIPVGRCPEDLPDTPMYYVVDVPPFNWLAHELLRQKAELTLITAGEFAIYRVQNRRGG